MKNLSLKKNEIHISLIRDTEMKRLNKNFRNKDKTTDVLSFEQNIQAGSFLMLGDVLISKDQTKKQAKESGHRIKDEFAILAIHGLLHLLGYDHMKSQDEKIMFGIQNELFQKTYHF